MTGYDLDPGERLAANEIRLLQIFPSADADHELHCDLLRITLDAADVHPYEALSYVWGDATMRANIICNKKLVSVTINLSDALKRLRLPRKSRFVWADAICIDQGSASEKSSQIPLMGKIYSLARTVIVWLGICHPAQNKEVLEDVKLIVDQLHIARKQNGSNAMTWKEYNALQVPREYTNTSTQEFFRLLYARPWFSRIWCVQEIILAQSAVLLWGDLELSWADVGEITMWLSSIQPTRALAYDDDAFYADIEYGNAEKMYAIQQKRRSLLATLDDCRTFQATDSRDKVYGILAIVEPADGTADLSVNYNKDVSEVYADVVIAGIRSDSNLDALAYVDHGPKYSNNDGFTSWSPRWDDITAGQRNILNDDSGLSACQDRGVTEMDDDHLNTRYLRLRGCYYSIVTEIHETMDLNAMEDQEAHPFTDILQTFFDQHKEIPVAGRDRDLLCKLARTLTAGCNSDMEDIEDLDEKEKTMFYASFFGYMSCACQGINFLTFREEHQLQDTFYDEAEIVCTSRRFFWAENGSFGIGPACMREGDIIVVLFGGNTPYILRPCGRCYLYMGQAYVDELMKGQLINSLDSGSTQEQHFVLV